MPPRVRMVFATLAMALFLIPTIALYRELSRRADISWTPLPLIVPVTQAADRVEVYVRGKPLATLLDAGQLRVMDGGSGSAVAPTEAKTKPLLSNECCNF